MATAVVCAWGSNVWGQCCHGAEEKEVIKRLEKPQCANSEISCVINAATPIVAVASGEAHTLFLTAFGDVFACGRASEGQLGLGQAVVERRRSTLALVEALQQRRVVDISCGNNHCIALCDDGAAFEWGLLLHNQEVNAEDAEANLKRTGMGKDFDALTDRQRRIVAKSWRQYFSNNMDFDCGDEAVEDFETSDEQAIQTMAKADCRRVVVPEPRECAGLEGKTIITASCGYAHTVLATSDGVLLSAGYGEKGQLGNGSRFPQGHYSPIQLPQERRLDVALGQDGRRRPVLGCGGNHSAAVTAPNGKLYTWGFGVFGQLGLGREKKETCAPALVTLSSAATQVACGANHTLVLTSAGDLFAFGHRDAVGGGSHYQRLPERKQELCTSSGEQVQRIYAGGTGNFAVLEVAKGSRQRRDPQLQAWGYNQHYQLGRFTAELELLRPGPVAIPALLGTQIQCFSAGSHHCIAVLGTPPCCVLPTNKGRPFLGHGPLLSALAGTPPFDVTVRLRNESGKGDETRGAHRCILQARCPKLAARLKQDARNESHSSRSWILDLGSYSAAAVEALLEFLYSDFCRAKLSDAAELRPLAEELGLRRLLAGIAAATQTESIDEGKRWVRTAEGRWLQVDVEPDVDGDAAHASTYTQDLQALISEQSDAVHCDPAEYVHLRIRQTDGATDSFCEVKIARVVLMTVEFFRAMLDGGFAEATQVKTSQSSTADDEDGVAMVDLHAESVSGMMCCLRMLVTGDLSCLPQDPEGLLAVVVEAHRLELPSIVNIAEASLASAIASRAPDEQVLQAIHRAAELYGLRKLLPRSLAERPPHEIAA